MAIVKWAITLRCEMARLRLRAALGLHAPENHCRVLRIGTYLVHFC